MSFPLAPNIPYITPNDTWRISQLKEGFQSLTQQLDSKQQIKTEKHKLDIILAIETKLTKEIALQHAYKNTKTKPIDSILKFILRRALYYFLLLFGVFEDTAGSYLVSSALLSWIPGVTSPFLMLASILYTGLGCVLFHAFEVATLKKILGIQHGSSELHRLLETYSKQLTTLKSVNQQLSSLYSLSINNALFDEYLQFVALLNQDLRKKSDDLEAYQEPVSSKILKVGVFAFGVLSSITGSYFMATYCMTICSVALIGSPMGWGIISLAITAGLGFSYVMGNKGMSRLVNPDYNKYQELKKDLHLFKEEYQDDLDHIRLIKHRFVEKKEMIDVATQTESPPFHQPRLTFFGPAMRSESPHEPQTSLLMSVGS